MPLTTTATDVGQPLARAVATGVCAPAEFPRDGILAVLEQCGHEVRFWHEDPDEAVAESLADAPEILLLGALRPNSAALRWVRELESTKTILICERSGQGEIRKALDAGIKGLVTLSEIDAALPPVIDVVRAGHVSVPGARRAELSKPLLTAREKQILGLVVMGMSNAEIAGKLFLAESTVKSHLSSAFGKLGVSSRSEASSLILDPQAGAGLGILTIPTR